MNLAPAVTMAKARSIALGAARAALRANHGSWEDCTPAQAWEALDDISRRDRSLLAGKFYRECSDAQYRAFCADWTRAARERKDRT
jgi:hypothetical protein